MSDKQPPSGITGIIHQLFAYVDRPWKALVVGILFVLGLAGYVFYQNQNQIMEYWLTPSEITLKHANIPAALDRLIDDTEADLIQLWSVDLASNTQGFIAARNKGGERPVIPNPRSLPIIVNVSDAKALVDALNGNPVCIELTDKGSPLARRLADRGMKWGCAIPIPPGPENFIGVIYLTWTEKPDTSKQDVAVKVAREVAGRLVTK